MQSTKNAALQTRFYSIPELDEPDLFEKILSTMESDAAVVLRAIVEDQVWPLDPESRETFAGFIAIQLLRGPEQRRMMEQIAALTTQLEIGLGGRNSVEAWARDAYGVTLTPEQAAEVWTDVIQPSGPPIQLAAREHIQQIGAMLPQVLGQVLARPWCLIRFDRRSLLTSDTPLARLPDPAKPGQAVGLSTTPGLTFPLTRKVGLLLATPLAGRVPVEEVRNGRFDFGYPPSTIWARLFNENTISSTREWLFHHPDDAHVVPDDLPQPRTTEITSNVDEFLRHNARPETT